MAHVTKGAPKKPTIDPRYLAIVGIALGLPSIYLGSVSPLIPAALALPALVWAADSIRRIAGYGLGTGVPSIGNLAIGMGVLTALVGLRYEPALGVALAALWGIMYGVIIGRLKILEIPVFTRCITELSVGASISLMCLLSAAAGGYTNGFFQGKLMPTLFFTGFVVAVFWATSMTVFHPFNACLGPGERQSRTLKLAVGVAGIDVTLAGIAALGVAGIDPSIMSLGSAGGIILIGAAVWVGGYYAFIKAAIKESASVMWTGFPEAKKK